MPVFEYQALDGAGKSVKGTVDAESARVARQRLRGQKIFVTEIKEGLRASEGRSKDINQIFQSNRIGLKELSIVTRQLATLINAGLPLVAALQALAEQTDSPILERIFVQVREDVEQGSTFAKSLSKFPKSFPSLYVNMVTSGEASGTLDTVLANLADYLETQVELRRKVFSALTYPILMLVICTLVIVGMLVFVIPKIVEIFVKQGAELPLPTKIVIALSDFVIGYWPLLLILIFGAAYLTRWYYRQENGRAVIDKLLLRLPVYGSTFIKINTARVARTLSALLSSGVGLLAALDITRNITSNVHMQKALLDARDGVQEGRSLARELGRSGHFPVLLSHMIAVGEKSGELEGMLAKAGKAYENEVNSTLAGLTSLLEPIMMIIVGGIVLMIVVSVLLPMADLITIIQK